MVFVQSVFRRKPDCRPGGETFAWRAVVLMTSLRRCSLNRWYIGKAFATGKWMAFYLQVRVEPSRRYEVTTEEHDWTKVNRR
jgi:hypothetical protein